MRRHEICHVPEQICCQGDIPSSWESRCSKLHRSNRFWICLLVRKKRIHQAFWSKNEALVIFINHPLKRTCGFFDQFVIRNTVYEHDWILLCHQVISTKLVDIIKADVSQLHYLFEIACTPLPIKCVHQRTQFRTLLIRHVMPTSWHCIKETSPVCEEAICGFDWHFNLPHPLADRKTFGRAHVDTSEGLLPRCSFMYLVDRRGI